MTRRPYIRLGPDALLLGTLLAGTLLAGTLLAALGPAPAWADQDFERARALRDAGEIVPFGLILQHARERHPGRVLNVKFEEDGGRYVYEVEVLDPKGVVWALIFDARTGNLIETMEESEEIRRDKAE